MDEYSFPRRDGILPPEEYPQPGPEFTPVGLRAAKDAAAEKRRKRKRIIYAIAAAALVLTSVGPFRLFRGSGSAAPAAPGTQQTLPGEQPSGGGTAKPGTLWPTLTGKQADPPELTASFTGETGGQGWFWLDYNADFLPAEDDETAYDLEVYRFGIYCYDKFGTFVEGTYVSASGIPDIEQTERSFHFHYDGPANGEFPEGTDLIAIWMQVRDKTTDTIYEVLTETAVAPPEPVYTVPEVEIYVTSFFSEFRGTILFYDMDDAESVTLQYWDPETESCDAEFDITEAALTDGKYNIAPFSTDFVYELHQEYYEEQNSFPMKLRIKVLVDYIGPAGHTLAEFESDSISGIGLEPAYVSSDENVFSDWQNPGCFQVQLLDCPEEYFILYDEEAIPGSENTVVVRLKIDGEDVDLDPAACTMLHREYDGSTYEDGEWVDHHYHTSLLVIPRPEGYEEDAGHVATVTMIRYMTQAEKAVAFEQEIKF